MADPRYAPFVRTQFFLFALLLGACVPPADEPDAPRIDDDDSTEPEDGKACLP